MKNYISILIVVFFSACSLHRHNNDEQLRNPDNFQIYKYDLFFDCLKKAYADSTVEDISGLVYATEIDSPSVISLDNIAEAYIEEIMNIDPTTVYDYGNKPIFAYSLGFYESRRLDSLVSWLIPQSTLKQNKTKAKNIYKDYVFFKSLEEGYKQEKIEIASDPSPSIYQDLSGFSIIFEFAKDLDSISTQFVANIPEVSPGKKNIFKECLAFYNSSALDNMIKKQMRVRKIKRGPQVWDL